MADWLRTAVFYEIYPQSFMDSNGDGIGDFQGIIERLDYIRSLGCNALWINPCFDSPFKDAGYDVRDYKKTAERSLQAFCRGSSERDPGAAGSGAGAYIGRASMVPGKRTC